MNNKLSNISSITFILSTMFLISMCDNLRGPYTPSFKDYFSINDTQIGIMFVLCSLGYMIFAYICGILCEKIGHKTIIYFGFIICFISIGKIFLSTSFDSFLVGLFFLNAGEAFIVISLNTLVPLIDVSFKAVIMNLLHFSYGFGAAFIQRQSGVLISNNINWRHIHFLLSILFLLSLIVFITIKIPNAKKNNYNTKIIYKDIFTSKFLYFYMFALGLYMAAEIATANWFVNFMKEAYNYSENIGSFYLSIFFGLIALGRFLGGYAVEKLGYMRCSLTCSIIGFTLYTIGYILGQPGFILISLSGLFLSIVFPTMILTINRIFTRNPSYVTSVILASSSACCMIINFLIGSLSDTIGIYKAFYTIPFCLFGSSIFTFFIYYNVSKNTDRKYNNSNTYLKKVM